jgi:hypothetical protein
MQIRSVGIDLGKTTFHLVALGDNGNLQGDSERAHYCNLERVINTSDSTPPDVVQPNRDPHGKTANESSAIYKCPLPDTLSHI